MLTLTTVNDILDLIKQRISERKGLFTLAVVNQTCTRILDSKDRRIHIKNRVKMWNYYKGAFRNKVHWHCREYLVILKETTIHICQRD